DRARVRNGREASAPPAPPDDGLRSVVAGCDLALGIVRAYAARLPGSGRIARRVVPTGGEFDSPDGGFLSWPAQADHDGVAAAGGAVSPPGGIRSPPGPRPRRSAVAARPSSCVTAITVRPSRASSCRTANTAAAFLVSSDPVGS